jgi:hypothetical protein
MLLFKIAADERFVAEAGDFFRVGNWINIHAALVQRFGDAALKRMPEEGAGPDENQAGRRVSRRLSSSSQSLT